MKKVNEKENKMGTEDERSILIKMSLPAIFSMIVQSIYNAVDVYFVSQIGEKALRSVSMAFPVQLLMIALTVGTSVGVGSYMSRKFGEGHNKEVGNGAFNGAFLILITWIIFILFRFLFLDLFYNMFTNDPEVMLMGHNYLGVVTLFSVFLFYQVLGEKILQAVGNMVIPMISHLISSFTNLILDPILIFGKFGFPELGTKGAAIATVTAQAVGFLFIISYILINRKKLGIDFSYKKINTNTIKQIYIVGLPSIIMTSVNAFLQMAMNWILSGINELGVSVMSVYLQLQSFVFMPIFGLGQGFLPLIGYNYGARKKDRLINLQRYAHIYTQILGIIGFIIFQVFAKQLLTIFNNEKEFLDIGVFAIRILSFTVLFAPISIVNSNFFQGLGNGKYSLFLSLIRQILIVLPLAYIFSNISLNLVWTSLPISEFIALILSIYYSKKIKRDKIDTITQ